MEGKILEKYSCNARREISPVKLKRINYFKRFSTIILRGEVLSLLTGGRTPVQFADFNCYIS